MKLETEIKSVMEGTLQKLPITFNMIQKATTKDVELQLIIKYSGNWPYIIDSKIKCYSARKDQLSISNECVIFGDRIVIPKYFRKKVLKKLHKGHNGIEKN